MKIALVLPCFDPTRGGAEHWTYQFAGRLLQAGHEVHVVAGKFGNDADGLGIVRHAIALPPRRWHRDYFAFGAAAARVIGRLDVDVVHDMGHGWCADLFQPHGGTRAGAARQNLRLTPPTTRWMKRLAGRLLPRYRALHALEHRRYSHPLPTPGGDLPRYVALSYMVRDDMLRYYSTDAERIHVIYNGVEVGRFSPERCATLRAESRERIGAGEDVVLLLVAHNFRLKGVATAVHAVGRLWGGGHPARLLVVGRDRPAPYRRLARRLGCADRIQFQSAVRDPLPWYAAADIYVHPTYYDPCSLVVLEALACGLPVVTTQCNGAGELLTPGRDGQLLDDPADAVGLSELLLPLLDPQRRQAMSAAARRKALLHSMDRNCAEFLSLYDTIRQAKGERRDRPQRGGAREHRAA